MNKGRLHRAVARIDAALARIEVASQRSPSADPALAERHTRLRKAAADALEQLDSVIAGQQR